MSDTNNCECQGWARVQPMDYMTKHHPNCKHYNDSLMVAWQVECQGIKSVVEHEQDAIDTAGGDPECAITKIRIHRECFDQLPDFEGF